MNIKKLGLGIALLQVFLLGYNIRGLVDLLVVPDDTKIALFITLGGLLIIGLCCAYSVKWLNKNLDLS